MGHKTSLFLPQTLEHYWVAKKVKLQAVLGWGWGIGPQMVAKPPKFLTLNLNLKGHSRSYCIPVW